MKKTFQIIPIEIEAAQAGVPAVKIVTENLKQEYSNCTGVFLVPQGSVDFSKLKCSLIIEGQEILPLDTDAVLLAHNGNVAMKDVVYSFKEDGIPARSSAMEFTLTNHDTQRQKVNLYLVLENI